jgi:MFS family permease
MGSPMTTALVRLSIGLFLMQAGFHGYVASLPVALSTAGVGEGSIGLIVGLASLVQIPAAFVGGALVDRFGGVRLLAVGSVTYVVASAILLLPGVAADGPIAPLLATRVLQGIGAAAVLPAAMSLVPRLIDPRRQGLGLSVIGSAHNLTGVVLPPVSIIVLRETSLEGVALLVIGVVAAGGLLVARLPLRTRTHADDAGEPLLGPARRRYGISYRQAWTVPLVVIVCYVAHWGAVTAFLPGRAEAAGADIGLFFAADGIAIMLMRIPSGWLADRITSRTLIVAGAGLTAAGMALLLLPLTTPLLVVVGIAGGAGGAIVMTPILVELSRRSSDADRGSAFALFSAALATAMTLGSVGAAPIVATAGFAVVIWLGLALIAVAIVFAVADRSLAMPRGAGATA